MTQSEIIFALKARGFAVDTAAGFRGAVLAFQASAGLLADGIVGKKTVAALKAPVAPKAAPASSIAAILTVARLRKMEPFARADILAGIVGSAAAIEAAGITTPQRLCHFLAQVAHESAGFARTEEALSYRAERICEVWPSRFPTLKSAEPYARNPQKLAVRVYGGRLGNLPAPSLDGWTFRGSGGLGTTGKANFAEVGADGDPDRLRTPEGFLAPALHYWKSRGCNALADRDDVEGLTRKINGGVNGLADRRARLAAARRSFV